MKQEEEAQSRFLISFSFFYCWCWMRPDDEFSLICFRPISEKTYTTSLPLSSILSFIERGPRRLVLRSETSHLNSLQQSRRQSRISTRATFEWVAPPLFRKNDFGMKRYEVDSTLISRTCILARQIIAFQRLYILSYEISIYYWRN